MDPGMDPAFPDVRLSGYLRKQKSQHRRYFVLRCASERGPARLEYYENEKKFRADGLGARPKKTFPLASALNINKRADARHRHLIVLYGREGTFGVAAENGEQQQLWYAAMVELHCKGKAPSSGGVREAVAPGLAFKEVWQVSLRPRGLGHTRNLAGTYLLCLTEKTINFVKLNCDVAAVVLQLLSVRRCGHSENYFFMEVGRSAATGPGELWMQVEDLVVAQNMHETILEAMKALSEEFRVRGRSQALGVSSSTPISVPLGNPPASQGACPWRPHPDGTPCLGWSPRPPGQKAAGASKPDSLSDYSAPSSDEGGSSPGDSRPPGTPDPLSFLGAGGELDYISMGKLASPDNAHCLAKWALGSEPHKRASLPPLTLDKDGPGLPRAGQPKLQPAVVWASYPEGLNLRGADPGYMAMLPGVAMSAEEERDYVPMSPGSVSPPRESGGYMLMSPSEGCSPDGHGPWVPARGGGRSLGSDYMNMSPISRSASSTPPEYSPLQAMPGGAAFCSLPRSYGRHAPRALPCPFHPGRLSCSSSTSSESLEELVGLPARRPLGLLVDPPGGGQEVLAAARSPGDHVSIEHHSRGGADDVSLLDLPAAPAQSPGCYAEVAPGAPLVRAEPHARRRHGAETFPEAERNGALLPPEAQADLGLNYIDLDLAKEPAPALRPLAGPAQGGPPHPYARIDFHRSGELRGGHADSEGAES
ncbi:insulin receptor substrate 1-like [Hemicordylus capensis]|uniref:insulin receptor substrate 1-like n=1 Tax=Hemicordylus capensis TaxID=884348 RepID=UPI002304159C|nr:insulin receptor substrate 1-like [Hemicordylus capensis]